MLEKVAPLTGAWIETMPIRLGDVNDIVAPLTGAWIETALPRSQRQSPDVAPLTGAWIETSGFVVKINKIKSHPSRVRGLKHKQRDNGEDEQRVAPLTGAWIETFYARDAKLLHRSRTPHGCVD